MEQQRPKPGYLSLAFSSSRTRPQVDAGVQKALHALASALDRRWTVSSLARHVGMSRAVLARKFTAALGSSPLRYLTERRMERARQLLEESELPLAAIAERVGYVSEFAFNRAFKRHCLVPPGTYRRRALVQSNESPRLAA